VCEKLVSYNLLPQAPQKRSAFLARLAPQRVQYSSLEDDTTTGHALSIPLSTNRIVTKSLSESNHSSLKVCPVDPPSMVQPSLKDMLLAVPTGLLRFGHTSLAALLLQLPDASGELLQVLSKDPGLLLPHHVVYG
jgi:hypothetical protein